jgi:hypothetical protein
MKMTYAELQTKPRTLCSLTGLRVQEFEALLPSFVNAWDSFMQDTFQHKDRQRAIGAGRKAHLSDLVDDVIETGCGLHNFRLPHRAKQRYSRREAA